jgi:DNA (cytosine-5)-methyltransferase 1
MKPKLLDLFCGAGGACGVPNQSGYAKYFDVTGVDIVARPTYPGRFVQADALDYVAQYGWMYAAIHASPPCEGHSHLTPKKHRHKHLDMIAPTRFFLEALGKPYVIENVSNARHLLRNPIMLCGSMFGLDVWRHRFFETFPLITFAPFTCCHDYKPVPVNSSSAQRTARKSESIEAMQITWDMTREEVRKALPPAYGEWLGLKLLNAIHNIDQAQPEFSLISLIS